MNSAEKLLERMRATKDGWKPRDFKQLYEGFGFTQVEGSNHTIYIYKATKICVTVARHRTLATGYAATAVKTIDSLKEKLSQRDDPNDLGTENEKQPNDR